MKILSFYSEKLLAQIKKIVTDERHDNVQIKSRKADVSEKHKNLARISFSTNNM